jgi:DNA polymerase-3 subunit delta'
MVDLLSLYRDVLLLHLGVTDEPINQSMRGRLDDATRASSPASTLAVMDAIAVARRRIESNVSPVLALEAMLVAISRHAVR